MSNEEVEKMESANNSSSTANEKKLKENSDDNSSTTSNSEKDSPEKTGDNSSSTANEEELKEKPDDNSYTAANSEKDSPEKADDDASTRTDAYQNQRTKTDNKGFDKDNNLPKDNSKIPYKGKNRESFATEEKNKYSSFTIEELNDLKNRYENKIYILNEDEKNKNDKIRRKQSAKSQEKDKETESHYEEEIKSLKEEVNEIQQKKDECWQELRLIKSEIERKHENSNRDYYSKTKNGKSQSYSSEEDENVTAESLFAEDDLIKNTVLYVATFFPGLNPQDFKRIVSLLLKDKKTSIIEQEAITNEEGKILVKETNKEKLLTEIWEESFDQPDKYLKQCHLIVSRQNGKPGIDFTLPKLRKDFLDYFETEQSFFLEEQLKRTQNLYLLLDNSDNVAEKAMEISVVAAIDYPDDYAEQWLIKLLEKIKEEDEGRLIILIGRLLQLIYKLQINPNYSRSKNIAQSLLERLISLNYTDFAFRIFQYLTEKHLSSGIIGFQLAKQLMAWLKKLLDNEKIKAENAYRLLEELLWNSGYYLYVYDFLVILKEWLPEPNLSPEKYTSSNNIILLLLFFYCEDTTWKLPLKFYGKWSSVHPLFASLYNENNSKITKQLDTLFGFIFYSNVKENEKKLAIKYIFEHFEINFDSITKISFFISEWLIILLGFDEDVEPRQEVLELIDCLIRQIILNTSRHQQKELNNCWASLTEEYLDLAIKYKELGNKEFQKQFTVRRKILKKFRKQFKSVQKEMKPVK